MELSSPEVTVWQPRLNGSRLGQFAMPAKPARSASLPALPPSVRRPAGLSGLAGDVLDHLTLSFTPLVDEQRNVVATRLTTLPLTGMLRLSADELISVLRQVWPSDGPPVWLNIAYSEQLLNDVLGSELPPSVCIEVPSFVAVRTETHEILERLHARGTTLVIKGRPLTELPETVLQMFNFALIDFADDRRRGEVLEDVPEHQRRRRTVSVVQSGVPDVAEAQQSFDRGIVAIAGWVPPPKPSDTPRKTSPEAAAIMEAIRRVDRGEPVERIATTLQQHPTLLYGLMGIARSPLGGLSSGTTALLPTILTLGYQRLQSCLSLLLIKTLARDDLRPLAYVALRRALFLERLAGDDEQARSEMFLCGMFSLLDTMLGVAFEQVFKEVTVPEAVYQTLAQSKGRYLPYLSLVASVESGERDQIVQSAAQLQIGLGEVNHVMLRALLTASRIE